MGKSSLVASVAERNLRDGWAVAIVVGGFSVAELAAEITTQTSAQTSALLSPQGRTKIAALTRPGREEEALLREIQALLRDERLLIVLDNFEDNLDRDDGGVPLGFVETAASEARTRSGLAEPVRALAAAAERGALVVTCRYAIGELDLPQLEIGELGAAAIQQLVLRLPGLREVPAKERAESWLAAKDTLLGSLSVSLERLGDVEVHAGNLAAARDLFQRDLKIAEGLAKADPHSAQAQRDLATSYERMAKVDPPGRIDWLTRAVSMRELRQHSDPTSATAACELAGALFQLGRALIEHGDEQTAAAQLARASQHLELLRRNGALESRYAPLADMLAKTFTTAD
ncbi:MAG: hypothetical protein IPK80_27200 [Nannocystis sp.]|nr:hypothetical protein [Nannocystis sp.]